MLFLLQQEARLLRGETQASELQPRGGRGPISVYLVCKYCLIGASAELHLETDKRPELSSLVCTVKE